jgi:16S rRNA U1498 N3-methylase RsmE
MAMYSIVERWSDTRNVTRFRDRLERILRAAAQQARERREADIEALAPFADDDPA